MNRFKVLMAVFMLISVISSLSVEAKATNLDEKDIYVQVLRHYQQAEGGLLESAVNRLVKRYPKGPLLDNALYLLAKWQFNNQLFKKALENIERIEQLAPTGNKRVSAWFLKASIYRERGLHQPYMNVLQKIMTHYPGSWESQQAWIEKRWRERQVTKEVSCTQSRQTQSLWI